LFAFPRVTVFQIYISFIRGIKVGTWCLTNKKNLTVVMLYACFFLKFIIIIPESNRQSEDICWCPLVLLIRYFKLFKTDMTSSLRVCNMVFLLKGRTLIDVVKEQGTEENIWTYNADEVNVKKLYNDRLHNLWSSPNNIRLITSSCLV